MLKSEINRCLKRKHPGLLRRTPSIERAENHLDKARNNIAAMKHINNGHFYDWTIISGYYAMYHAALAALWLIGLWGKDHACVVSAIRFFYAERGKIEEKHLSCFDKAKKLEEKYIETFERARRQRTEIQYGIIEVRNTDVEWINSAAMNFVDRIEEIVLEAKGLKVARG